MDTTDTLIVTGGPMGTIETKEIPLSKIKLAKNSRMNIKDDEIAGLMQSIKEQGLLQPIGVVKNAAGYEICYGNRRFLAYSKLGKTKILATIHINKSDAQNDIMNLTENIQRRNISLLEAGRYIDLLTKSGLAPSEIAVRLGVTLGYVKSCITAFAEVPKKYHKDLEVKTTTDRTTTPGKIGISTAKQIVTVGKKMSLRPDQEALLYDAAKSRDDFNTVDIKKYALAILDGKKDFIKETSRLKHMAVFFYMEEDEFNRLYNKHVANGAFKSVNRLCVSVLRGEKVEKMKIK